MRDWVKWMIHHRLRWFLKILVVISYPAILLSYCGDAYDDMEYTLDSIDREK